MLAFTLPFILIREDGKTRLFYSLDDLRAACIEDDIQIADHFVSIETVFDGKTRIWKNIKFYNEFIVRDDRGCIVKNDDIFYKKGYYYHRKLKKLVPFGFGNFRIKAQIRAQELGLPIPYIGKGRSYKFHRNFRFVASNRACAASEVDDGEYDFKIKGKIKKLPTNWDDICKSSVYDRNWKRFRKTKWK